MGPQGDSRAVPRPVLARVFGLPAGKAGRQGFFSRMLLGWYLREARRLAISEEPGEAIVTYPLA
jgi:hypothetical protein